MKYIDLLNRFWEANRADRFTTAERELYYYLLNECNHNYWRMPVSCSTSVACAVIGMNRATLVRAREGLRCRGLILFEEGMQNSRAPTYTILDTGRDTVSATASATADDTADATACATSYTTQIHLQIQMRRFRLMNWNVGCWRTASGTNRSCANLPQPASLPMQIR